MQNEDWKNFRFWNLDYGLEEMENVEGRKQNGR